MFKTPNEIMTWRPCHRKAGEHSDLGLKVTLPGVPSLTTARVINLGSLSSLVQVRHVFSEITIVCTLKRFAKINNIAYILRIN